MRSAFDIYNEINSDKEKEKKYRNMMSHQEQIITDAIKHGDIHGSRLFVFSDRGYFNGAQRDWYEEFYNRAKKEMEAAGYRIVGICVCW